MLVDFQYFCTPALDAVRRINKNPIRIYAWMTAQVAYLVGTHAPAKWGGQGDLSPKIEEEAAKSGKSLDDAAKEVNLPTSG